MVQSVIFLLFFCLLTDIWIPAATAFSVVHPTGQRHHQIKEAAVVSQGGGRLDHGCRVMEPFSTSLNVFGNKKSSAAKLKDAEKKEIYWQGEWVCKDCGYIYNRGECGGLYFEEQGVGFRCPQCSGPRRRYAKKVGDRVGTTLDGGDAPILIFSFGGVIATIIFGFWAANNL